MAVTSKVTVYWGQSTWRHIPEVNHHTKATQNVNLILIQFSSDWWLVYIVGTTEHYTYEIKYVINLA